MNLLNSIDNLLDTVSPFYVYLVGVLHILNFTYIILFAFFGIVILDQDYIKQYNRMIQMFVCVFLLFKFHPFREHTLKKVDSKIIFGSALFLLLNLGIVQFMNSTIIEMEKTIKEIV